MNKAVERMLERYALEKSADAENALREIVQEIALYGLWQGGFFKKTAFYGGTALRIFYGLDRFSEDMDFSLLEKNPEFSFEPYKGILVNTLGDFGFSVEFSPRKKPSENGIWSAFLKGNTLNHLMSIGIPENLTSAVNPKKALKVKIEVDIDPPGKFATEMKPALNPIPHNVRIYTEPCLFAGKMHATLFRHWGNRVKGRDWYDMLWYLQRGTVLDLPHLEEKMRQGGQWTGTNTLNEDAFLSIYRQKAADLDIEKAIQDVRIFLQDPRIVETTWSNELFINISDRFRFQK